MSQIFAIVLAAGQGKRMKSNIPKVAHMLLKKPLLQWSIDALLGADIAHIMVVISRNPVIEEILNKNYEGQDVRFCYQDKPLGTAHAVQCGLEGWKNRNLDPVVKPRDDTRASRDDTRAPRDDNRVARDDRPWDDTDTILIAYGDTPGVKSETYKKLVQFHTQEENAITIIAFYAKNPFGYGRIILDEKNEFVAIREEKDCSPQEKLIDLCHSGVMCANYEILESILPQIKNQNEASEFYLTDVIRTAKSLGHKVGFIASNQEREFSGVNTPEQLAALESTLCAV